MTNEVERRLTRGAVALRETPDGGLRIGGYAAKFRKLSQNLGGFVEQIERGFFDKSRDAAWAGVMARYNHETLLGTVQGGSLRLALDDTGLDYEVDLLDDPTSMRVHKLVQRGDVSQSSFAMYVYEDDWAMSEQGFPLRTLLEGSLVDVAPVDQPAYTDTSTGLRSLAESRSMDVSEVKALAEAGELSRILKTPATTIDLGGPTPDERGETGGSWEWLLAKRRALEIDALAD